MKDYGPTEQEKKYIRRHSLCNKRCKEIDSYPGFALDAFLGLVIIIGLVLVIGYALSIYKASIFGTPKAEASEIQDNEYYCERLDEYMMSADDEPLIREYCLTN